jgi:predicted nucleic acid-binding protein
MAIVVDTNVLFAFVNAQDKQHHRVTTFITAIDDVLLVPATVLSEVERLNITRILTLDHRHFGIIRPRHCAYFSLLPQ